MTTDKALEVATYQSPVGDNTGDLDGAVLTGTGDEVLNGSGIEELDVGELQDLAEKGAGEESGVLDNDIVAVITILLICDTNLAEEGIGGFSHDHGREELATKPSTTTRGDTGLDDGDLQVRTSLSKTVGSTETARAGANDDDVGLGVLVQVGEVATSHGSADLRLTDGTEVERLPVTSHGLNGLRLGLSSNRNCSSMRKVQLLGRNSRRNGLLEDHGRGRHCDVGLRWCGSVAD